MTPLSRRALLRRASLAGGAVALFGCGPNASPAPSSTPVAPSPSPAARAAPTSTPRPAPTWNALPRWRGFNLDWKAPYRERELPFVEWDFDFMAEWGFDFVRLAVDYRRWSPLPRTFVEEPLRDIDQAINWARERRIHTNLDLHNAPGYDQFAKPRLLDLFADGATGDQMRQQFAEQWRMLAARYRGVPSADLSFNLVNEPSPEVSAAAYARAVTAAVNAIRAEDPERLIIADGLVYARRPLPELAPLRIAQSLHQYEPFTLTHFRAEWAADSATWPLPTWPLLPAPTAFLYGPLKRDLQSPLVLRGAFSQPTELRITVRRVSSSAELMIDADGGVVFRTLFQPGPGTSDWKELIPRPQFNSYEAVYDRAYTATIPAGTRETRLQVTSGDWLTFSEISLRPWPGAATNEVVLKPSGSEFGVRQDTYTLDAQGNAVAATARPLGRDELWLNSLEPWKKLETSGVGVMVGEWGAYRFTPHSVVLRWMQDVLDLFRSAGWGWALWHLRGGFGPVDSDRSDASYELYRGHKLDRKMLEVLRTG